VCVYESMFVRICVCEDELHNVCIYIQLCTPHIKSPALCVCVFACVCFSMRESCVPDVGVKGKERMIDKERECVFTLCIHVCA